MACGVIGNIELFQAENELRRDWRTDYSIWVWRMKCEF